MKSYKRKHESEPEWAWVHIFLGMCVYRKCKYCKPWTSVCPVRMKVNAELHIYFFSSSFNLFFRSLQPFFAAIERDSLVSILFVLAAPRRPASDTSIQPSISILSLSATPQLSTYPQLHDYCTSPCICYTIFSWGEVTRQDSIRQGRVGLRWPHPQPSSIFSTHYYR